VKQTTLNRLIACFVFVISSVQYFLTLQPSVSLWDPGELSAAAFGLQISHPPGAPLFSLLGRVFFMLPFPGDIGVRINVLSAVASALAVLLLYLIAVKLIGMWRQKHPTTMFEALGTYGSAAIGALAFSFSDTVWFNAVESNVFGMSLFLFALIAYLALVWHEKADSPDSARYLVLIAYVAGLAIGVQVMSVLSLMVVGMLFVFRRYTNDDKDEKKTALIFLGYLLILAVVALGMWAAESSQLPPTEEEFKAYDLKFLLIVAGISLATMIIFRKKIFKANSYFTAFAAGVFSVGLLFIGIMKIFPALIRFIAGGNTVLGILVALIVLALLAVLTVWARKNERGVLSLVAASAIVAVIGFSIYAIIVIRSNQHLQMNEGKPNTFSRLAPYLNREQYGAWPLFKRRWSVEPTYRQTWTEYSSDLDFFNRYQMNNMFSRYLFWNFIGREVWVKDAAVNWSQLYGIPFLLGLIGLYVHFRKNWKIASSFLILFILSGFLISFYGNMQDPQPRDRDYYYTGAFFVFSIWIALGMRGILDFLEQKFPMQNIAGKVSAGLVLCLGMVFVPARMMQTNYYTHDRSKNYLPRDYAYNLLQSCQPGSILFTNGDDDTFPLWYLQDVEGVRRDVRIVSLSLANAGWYIKQLKHQPYDVSPAVKISMTDDALDTIQPIEWQDQTVSIPVAPEVISSYAVTDSSVIRSGAISFTMPAAIRGKETSIVRVQDLAVLDIIRQNLWEKPIYFAVTTAQDARIGIGAYLRTDGMALRIMPQKNPTPGDRAYYINEPLMRRNFIENPPADYSAAYQAGFRFTGLNDRSIYYDDTQWQMIQNYRASYFALAFYYLYQAGDKVLCKQTIDRMEANFPRDIFRMDLKLLYYLTSLYYNTGDSIKFRQVSVDVEKLINEKFTDPRLTDDEYVRSNSMLIELYDRTQEYSKTVNVIEKLLVKFPGDEELQKELTRYSELAREQDSVKSAGR
jgi:hypothetical protein